MYYCLYIGLVIVMYWNCDGAYLLLLGRPLSNTKTKTRPALVFVFVQKTYISQTISSASIISYEFFLGLCARTQSTYVIDFSYFSVVKNRKI